MPNNRSSVKPFYLVTRRKGPNKTVTDVDVCQFQETILNHLRDDEKNHPYLLSSTATWGIQKSDCRGFTGEGKVEKAAIVETILVTIATFAPPSVYKEITKMATCLSYC